MKAAQREIAKQIIIDSQIKRLSRTETLEIIRSKGIKISLATLKQYKTDIKQDARDWITNLAKNRNDYIALYKEGIDELRLLQHEAWKIMRDPRTKPFVQIQAILAIAKLRGDIANLCDAMPVVMALKDYIGVNPESESTANTDTEVLQQ